MAPMRHARKEAQLAHRLPCHRHRHHHLSFSLSFSLSCSAFAAAGSTGTPCTPALVAPTTDLLAPLRPTRVLGRLPAHAHALTIESDTREPSYATWGACLPLP